MGILKRMRDKLKPELCIQSISGDQRVYLIHRQRGIKRVIPLEKESAQYLITQIQESLEDIEVGTCTHQRAA